MRVLPSVCVCVSVCVLVSFGCRNKFSQSEGLTTTEIYTLTVLDAWRTKSSCWQGLYFLERPWGRFCSLPLSASCGFRQSWFVAPSLQPLPPPLPSQVSLCLSPVGMALVIGFGAHSGNPEWSHLKTPITPAKTRFPNKTTNDLQLWTWTHGATIQPTTLWVCMCVCVL